MVEVLEPGLLDLAADLALLAGAVGPGLEVQRQLEAGGAGAEGLVEEGHRGLVALGLHEVVPAVAVDVDQRVGGPARADLQPGAAGLPAAAQGPLGAALDRAPGGAGGREELEAAAAVDEHVGDAVAVGVGRDVGRGGRGGPEAAEGGAPAPELGPALQRAGPVA
ncbi:MAG: hypothetical protein ACK559_30945, partial [bacterium]